MDVSIIIVNYNTRDITNDCINSIVEKTQGIQYEIILVDNASTDGSKEFFEKDERIKYIYSEKNGGFGYGNTINKSFLYFEETHVVPYLLDGTYLLCH